MALLCNFKKVHIAFFILVTLLFLSCRKEDTYIIKGALGTNSSILIGPTSTKKNWHLTSYFEQNISLPLTSAQLIYTKKYLENNTFITSDGLNGTWKLLNINTMEETYTNLPGNNPFLIQSYTIETLNSTTLKLLYLKNGISIATVYTAGF
jgi:hypothetical protein